MEGFLPYVYKPSAQFRIGCCNYICVCANRILYIRCLLKLLLTVDFQGKLSTAAEAEQTTATAKDTDTATATTKDTDTNIVFAGRSAQTYFQLI